MISRQFFAWARDASASERAAGAASLVCDFLHMDLTIAEAAEVESILTVLLDDPSLLVRRAIAEGFAGEARAPRHILSALAADQPEIAAIVLAKAPQFSASELMEIVRAAGSQVQMSVARRAGLPAAVCEVLADCAGIGTLMLLALNETAQLSEAALLRMLERAGRQPRLREALLRRPDLPASVRAGLAEAVSRDLSDFLARTGWLSPERTSRVLRDVREKVLLSLGAGQGGPGGAAASLARHLRVTGQLTPALLLRSLLGGDALLFTAALAELAGLPGPRVAAVLACAEGPAFDALYRKAGLPESIQPVFAALLRELARPRRGHACRRLAGVAMEACGAVPESERGRLLNLIRRFEAEAMREEARRMESRATAAA